MRYDSRQRKIFQGIPGLHKEILPGCLPSSERCHSFTVKRKGSCKHTFYTSKEREERESERAEGFKPLPGPVVVLFRTRLLQTSLLTDVGQVEISVEPAGVGVG